MSSIKSIQREFDTLQNLFQEDKDNEQVGNTFKRFRKYFKKYNQIVDKQKQYPDQKEDPDTLQKKEELISQLTECAFASETLRSVLESSKPQEAPAPVEETPAVDVEAVKAEAFESGLSQGKQEGHSNGVKEGYQKGYDEGRKTGYSEGFANGQQTSTPPAPEVVVDTTKPCAEIARLLASIALFNSGNELNPPFDVSSFSNPQFTVALKALELQITKASSLQAFNYEILTTHIENILRNWVDNSEATILQSKVSYSDLSNELSGVFTNDQHYQPLMGGTLSAPVTYVPKDEP